ncbi:Bro-N domain-containing protein [Pseudorhodoferax sp.]|uniref:BRO-N domain-containing protein n=1 Tax=Pseudorhodoferax sp. TaxID=1993553 RepID=UPI0039E58194
MSNIVPFNFDGHPVTVIADAAGDLQFVAKEVADILGYSEASAMTRYLDEDEKGLLDWQTPGGKQKVIAITESGLYSAILRSERPEAKRFKKWVTSEVLPSIRKTGSYAAPAAKAANPTGLPEFRRARALDLATKTAERIVAQFPSLNEQSRQVVFAKVINPVAGMEILALPHVEKKHHSATEVGELLGISANMVGRIANQHGLKTAEHGRYQLDKSRHSSKQVEAFVYNDAGIEAVKLHLDADRLGHQPAAEVILDTTGEPRGALQ